MALRGYLSARTAAPSPQQRLFRSETTAQARRWDKCAPVPRRAAFSTARRRSTPISERGHSGSGMNSASSPGTLGKSPSCQLRLASSIRAFELETKFHQMCRWPSIGAPPRSTMRASAAARRVAAASANTRIRPRSARSWPQGMRRRRRRRLASRERPVLNPAYRCARYAEGRAAVTGEVGCSDLSGSDCQAALLPRNGPSLASLG